MPAALSTSEKYRNQEWWRQLPFPYESCALTSGSRPDGFRFFSFIINIEAKLIGRTIWACGEANDQKLAMTKAIAELIERSALIVWKNQNKGTAVSSNGWAAHSSIESAKTAALLELVERDAGLCQWYTASPFLQLPVDGLPIQIQRWSEADLSRSEFPILKILLTKTGVGPSVTCIFMNADGFGVSGHSTRLTLAESIESAIGEACRAAHMALRKSYWCDTIALRDNESANVSPGAHSVYYAYHEPFPLWVFGQKINWESANVYWNSKIESALDLEATTEILLNEPVVVAFASSKITFPLTWGPTNLDKILSMPACKRFVIKQNEWNIKPHIIS